MPSPRRWRGNASRLSARSAPSSISTNKTTREQLISSKRPSNSIRRITFSTRTALLPTWLLNNMTRHSPMRRIAFGCSRTGPRATRAREPRSSEWTSLLGRGMPSRKDSSSTGTTPRTCAAPSRSFSWLWMRSRSARRNPLSTRSAPSRRSTCRTSSVLSSTSLLPSSLIPRIMCSTLIALLLTWQWRSLTARSRTLTSASSCNPHGQRDIRDRRLRF
mmetsp:Transcript_40817/g.67801  ORF Transcript_40817/g.67801 Transcript_40817/m.67801 type:complete len:218 (+) Transcript_40817:1509-2162(+)